MKSMVSEGKKTKKIKTLKKCSMKSLWRKKNERKTSRNERKRDTRESILTKSDMVLN